MDFFPIVKTEIQNFPNLNNFILPELHFKKIKIKIREPFRIEEAEEDGQSQRDKRQRLREIDVRDIGKV